MNLKFTFDDFVVKKAPVKKECDLFEEKHKPKKLKNVLGNKKQILTIQNWIDNKKEGKETKNFIILFGHNGTGKSLITDLILKENGYQIFQLSSDIYPQKKDMLNKLERVLSSKSIQMLVSGKNPTAIVVENIEKTLGEGITYTNFVNLLIKHKENVKNIPIICISSSEKIKKKYNTPTKLKLVLLEKPGLDELVLFGAKVLRKENDIKITRGALKKIIKSSNFDVRKYMQFLKIFSLSNKKMFNLENIQHILDFSETDTFFNAYEVIDDFLKKENRTLEDKINLCMIDQPLIIDLLYSNVPYLANLENTSRALESLSFSDLIQVKIFREHCWELREFLITSSCIKPSTLMKKEKIKKSYVIKKNQLNNLPCICVRNKNIFNEVRKKGKLVISYQDLLYSVKYIYNPKIKLCLKNKEDPTQLVSELFQYGVNFNDYLKLSNVGFNKTDWCKTEKDILKKTWSTFDRENFIEIVRKK